MLSSLCDFVKWSLRLMKETEVKRYYSNLAMSTIYVRKKNKNSTTMWSCKNRQICKGSLTISETSECVHNEARNEVNVSVNKFKKRAREESRPIPSLYNEEMGAVLDSGYEFVTQVPSFHSIKSKLCRYRNKAMGVVHFKNRSEILLPDKYGQNFLLFDDGTEDVS